MLSKERSSNFELLRIVAMVLIMIAHIFQHSVNTQIFEPKYSPAGEYFSRFATYKCLLITYYARAFGQIGNSIFILISGYFLINKEHIDLIKQVKKLLSQVLFATIIFLLVSMVFLKTGIIKTGAVVLEAFNNDWWFIGLYIAIIVTAELLLNRKILKLSQRNYLMCLLLLFALVSSVYTRSFLYQIASGLELFVAGVFLYLLGGYIRIYNPFGKLRSVTLIMILLCSFMLMAVSYYNFTHNSINQAVIDNASSYTQVEYLYYDMYAIPCLMISISVFEFFRRISISTIKIINYIAGATFMMYLTHENTFVWEWLMKIKWNEMLFKGYYTRFFLLIAVLLSLFIILGVAMYSLFKLICSLMANERIKKIFLRT